MWLRSGMFEGDMFSAELESGKIICKGQLDWLNLKDATIVLDAKTGEVIGGDEEAMVVAGKLVPSDEILKIYKV